MTDMNEQTPATGAQDRPSGDLGRRLAARRVRLGLTREETAARAGMAPSYVTHLEQHADATPGRGVLRALATALQTTVSALTGGDADLPPGPGRAGHAPEFTELSPAECAELLSTHGVGRLAVATALGPVIVPVNYSVVDDTIVFRTAAGATPSLASGGRVAFEVDRIDDAFSQGWSVLARGYARTVRTPVKSVGSRSGPTASRGPGAGATCGYASNRTPSPDDASWSEQGPSPEAGTHGPWPGTPAPLDDGQHPYRDAR